MDTNAVLIRLGQEILKRRKQLGISQEELAERSGLHRTYISDIERGNRNCTVECLVKFATGLQISLATLFAAFTDD